MDRDLDDLIDIFTHEFAASHRTRLLPGGEEPLYRPAVLPGDWHEIVFRHDYFQSALHEIAHWCVAGAARRQQLDYGYWYDPDGRTRARQDEFERVEARPQAVEWVLSVACGRRFAVSLDNLDAAEPLDAGSLWRAVHREAVRCLDDAGELSGLPPRALQLARVLAAHFRQPWPLPRDYFAPPPGTICGPSGLSGMVSCGGVNSTV